ncbi:MAG TPA: GNAT family protein [Caulobacteraceae bacterium]|nr:GNAT family protein [Caulobacteraceae bacterium]
MALLDWIASDHDLRLEGAGVRLRPHRSGDFTEWAMLRSRSRAFLQPWEPTWPADDLTRGAWRRRLAAYAHDIERGLAYPFLVFRSSDGAMVGGITLSNIRRGVAQMGSIGYWVGEPFTRRGHTSAAVLAVTRFCFERLGLHRVEAACIPSNEASRGVLMKAGFTQEGMARAYLRINGIWQDHLLFGLVSPAPAGQQRIEDVLV